MKQKLHVQCVTIKNTVGFVLFCLQVLLVYILNTSGQIVNQVVLTLLVFSCVFSS